MFLCYLVLDFVGFWAIHFIHLIKQIDGNVAAVPLLLRRVSATSALSIGALWLRSTPHLPLIWRLNIVVLVTGNRRLIE